LGGGRRGEHLPQLRGGAGGPQPRQHGVHTMPFRQRRGQRAHRLPGICSFPKSPLWLTPWLLYSELMRHLGEQKCGVNTYSAAGGVCMSCNGGSTAGVGASACTACAAPSVPTTGGVCGPCGPGSFSQSSGYTSQTTGFVYNTCSSCADGKYIALAGATSRTACLPCQVSTAPLFSPPFGSLFSSSMDASMEGMAHTLAATYFRRRRWPSRTTAWAPSGASRAPTAARPTSTAATRASPARRAPTARAGSASPALRGPTA
jgi:hypothetical protein